MVVGASAGRPVFLRDVARIADGPEEPATYVRFGGGAAANGAAHALGGAAVPAVTIAVAKHKGENAVAVVGDVMRKLDGLRGTVVPGDVQMSVSRDYGSTAKDKSNELLLHMGIAVVSVALLIGFALGRRESVIVMLAIPATLALTLAVFYFLGYTLNRITLFALIFSIGILVDDAIVIVENIDAPRAHARQRTHRPGRDRGAGGRRGRQPDDPRDDDRDRGDPADGIRRRPDGAVHAADPDRRVGGDALLAARRVRRDAVGDRAALAPRARRRSSTETESRLTRFYRRVMSTLLGRVRARTVFLGGVVVLLSARWRSSASSGCASRCCRSTTRASFRSS